MASTSKSPASASNRDPEAAYRDDSIDDAEAPLLRSPILDDEPKPFFDRVIRWNLVFNALAFPCAIAASCLTPTKDDAIFFIVVFSLAAGYNFLVLLLACVTSKKKSPEPSSTSSRTLNFGGYALTLERSTNGRGLGWWFGLANHIFWIIMLFVGTLVPPTAGMFHRRWARDREHAKRGLIAFGTMLIVFQTAAMLLTYFPRFAKSRVVLYSVKDDDEKRMMRSVRLPTESYGGRSISIHA